MTVCYWCGAKDTLADVGKELDDGKYKMVQCSKCKNAYYVVNREKMNKPKPMTNEEWLRTLPTDERVKEILSRGFMTEKRTAEEFVEWLQEVHNDGKH